MSQQADALALSRELCRALGVTDLHDVVRVELVIEAGRAPRLAVVRQLVREGVLGELETKFDLVPQRGPVDKA